MSRPLIALVLTLALVVVLLFAVDPLGLFQGDAIDRDGTSEGGEDYIEDPVLTGRSGAVAPGETTLRSTEPVGILDLGLGNAALAGLVTGDGMPLGAARVRVVLPPPHDDRGVRTRADGTWEVRGLPVGSHEVRATHAEYRGRTTVVPNAPEGVTTTCETIDLARRAPPEDGLVVKVTDEFGRPIAGAKVLLTTMNWGLHMMMGPEVTGTPDVIARRGTTDERGEAALLALTPEIYDLVATAPGFQPGAQPRVVVQAGRVRHVVLRLVPGFAISGTVFGPGEKPVEGVYVVGFHQPSWASALPARTGADGRFVLEGLRPGNYWVIAASEDAGEGQANPVASPSQDLRLQLSGAGRVEITVVRPDGTPVPRYHVRPFKADAFGYFYSPVYPAESEDGTTTIALGPGTYNLSVTGEEGDVAPDQEVLVEAGASVSARIELPSSKHVSGTVVAPDGSHVANAEIYIRMGGMPGGPRLEQYARSDADGAFRVAGLPSEIVKLHVEHESFATQVVEVDLTGDASPDEMTIRLPAGGIVEGRITRGDAPVASEQVTLWQNWFHPKTTVTSADGRYRFQGITPGTWNVSTGKFEWGAGGASKMGVPVTDGGTATVDLQLGVTEGTHAVTGFVKRGGVPVSGATVSVIDSRGYESMVSVRTDTQGAFRAEGIRPGSVTVQIATDDGARATEYATVGTDGESDTIEIELGAGGVRGQLVMLDGTPVSAAWIQVEVASDESGQGWGRVRAQITSDPEGYFVAGGLDPGRYQIRVTGSGHAGMLSDPFEVGTEGVVDLGTFRLATGVSIQGRVADDQGTPIEDVTISLHDDTGRPVYLFSLATTGSDGRYGLTGLEPGRYTIGFEARGYAPSSQEIEVGAQGKTVDATLSAGGTVEVAVLDEGGTPVPGVRVGLRDATGRLVARTLSLVSIFQGEVGRTDPRGTARIPDLAPGTYTVTLRSEGWQVVGDEPRIVVSARQVVATGLTVRAE